MAFEKQTGSSDNLISQEMVQAALDRVVGSEIFEGSPRLSALLNYVVQKYFDEQGHKIQAKAIAEDLYNRSTASGPGGANLVRVDAGRLRRRLGEYYSGPGIKDPLIIRIDTGGYNPRFDLRTNEPASEASLGSAAFPSAGYERRSILIALGIALVFFVGVGAGLLFARVSQPQDSSVEIANSAGETSSENIRKALLSASIPTLEATNLATQARGLFFPLIELDQIRLTLAMFKLAVRKDQSYFGGYAGAAQSLATLAIFSTDATLKNEYLEDARNSIERALQLAPTDAWTHSAIAWVSLAEGNPAQAMEHANIAAELAPNDGHILDFHAALMLCLGDFEAAKKASAPSPTEPKIRNRVINYSFNGAANYHLGLYEEALESLLGAAYGGEPLSAPTLAYIAASYQALGDVAKANNYAQHLSQNWPKFSPDVSLSRLYVNPEQTAVLQRALMSAGWKPSSNSKLETDGKL